MSNHRSFTLCHQVKSCCFLCYSHLYLISDSLCCSFISGFWERRSGSRSLRDCIEVASQGTLAALHLPQVLISAVNPRILCSSMDIKKKIILISLITQFPMRLNLIVPLESQITKATGVVLESEWAEGAFYLLLFMLASHIF